MDKENGEGSAEAGKPPPQDGLLDAAGLFGAYWGRDGAAGGGAAAQAQAQAQAALFGFGGRYPPPTTLGVAANQAASLGLHPAASAAWWSMASHLAAQDYLARLQASGLNFPPMADPYSALSALSAAGLKQPQKPSKQPSRNERSGRSSTSSGASNKDKSPSTSTSNSQPHMRSSYGFPKTSSPSTMHSHSQSLSSLASLNSLVSHQTKSSKQQQPPQQSSRKPSGAGAGAGSSSSSCSKSKERDLALLRGDLMLAQAAAHGAYHAAVAAAAKGKNMSSLYPFGMPGSEKDRHSGIDSLTGLPHTILSDPSSVLGGVRLPPDTEIIKYTSSLAGPKAPPGTTNRGRKKTISLDPPQVSVHPSSGDRGTPVPSKRQKVDEYGKSRSSVEVIRVGAHAHAHAGAHAATPPPSLPDYAGISRELLQTIASQSGVSLAALERQLAGTSNNTDSGLNLSTKSSDDSPLDLGVKQCSMDDDAPLNLSLKPTPSSHQASDALSRLTSLSSSLNASGGHDRISRRKPGAKPRRVAPELNTQVADSPRPKSSGSEDSESVSTWPTREGRPRNLGRGVSKPKKNTVASLLAQSRALGLRPALAQQLLGETDLEKLKALLGESASTDSECVSDSCPSDSDASDTSRRSNDAQLRLPLALGWKRVTVIRGLSRNCNIKGDVSYSPPEPHTAIAIKTVQELHTFMESNPNPPLSSDNFSFSARVVLGEYVQPAELGEPLVFNEQEITKRLEEARALAALTGPRPTPPPVDRRIELARRQQAARDARRDANARSRDQARLVRELERTEKAESVKRDKEARSQQLLEHINKNRTQLTIEPLPSIPKSGTDNEWKIPEIVMGPAIKTSKDRTMPPISLSLIPVSGKDTHNVPIKTINFDSNWKEDEYNALDKMKDFAEKAAFDLPKRPKDKYFDISLMKAHEKRLKSTDKEDNLEKLIESYSRITEFINGCNWSQLPAKKSEDAIAIEQKYLDAKNEFMSQNLALMPKDGQKSVLKEVIDLSEDDETILSDIITKKISEGTFNIGKDGALSISVHPLGSKDALGLAKRKKQEEIEKQKIEDQVKRQQERELKRQQAMLLKEQQKYITEERERRRQHTTFIRQLDSRKRWEERERRKHQNLLDRLLVKEKKLQQRRKEMELLAELRRPQEDSSLSDQKPLPTLNRIPGLKLPGQAFAHILQVYEFIHNFGQTLGFDMDNIPSLNTFQMALLPDCCADAEDELIQVLTQLLVCAIEDPGIPHPGRHTTLLGHAIRMGDITPANLSEVLRIYLYANATGEVKALTGLTAERERERRVADHHQTEAEMQHTCASTKNANYYEHLHSNNTYKLSESLRDKPFLALNPTIKAKILSFLCDELLQNKSVLRQIDGSLEHLNQLKKERYLLDMKIRKVRVLHQRKLRSEQAEKQQALALERMQRLVEESTANLTRASPLPHDEEQPTDKETPKKDSSTQESEEKPSSPYKEPPPEDSDKELSPLKDLSNMNKSKEALNNNKEDCSPENNSKLDKDSVIGDCDANLSDLESEGTQPEEDEDKNLSSEELSRKLDKLMRQSEQQSQQLAAGTHALRATCYGQDRYWRRYWSLGKCGGIFVEGMESAQPEIMEYHHTLETNAKEKPAENTKKKKGAKDKKDPPPESESMDTEEAMKVEALKTEMELKSIKSELNLSDHTQIIKYEPNVKHGACKVEGSSIKMEEKYIQQQQHNEAQDMLDIEDSIPTAFLVQKPSHKPMYASQAEPVDKPQEIVKVENVIKKEERDEEESKDELVNNLEELRKLAEAVSSQLDAAKKAEAEVKVEEKDPLEVKKEVMEPSAAHSHLYTKILEGKWFSILRHESAFLNNINEVVDKTDVPNYCDNEHTCAEVILCQGHKWDVSNNLHLLNDPSLFTLNSMVTSVQVPLNSVYADSSLTMSGLDQDMMNASLNRNDKEEEKVENGIKEQDNDLEKELQADALKHDLAIQKAKANSLTSLGLLNFNALSTYVTCDSPPPIQMTADEVKQLEHCKQHGLPKRLGGTFVPRELRHGWWRITESDQLRDLMETLHPRGVRERELHTAFVQHIPTVNNKIYIERGDVNMTELSITHLDRVIAQSGGFPSPDFAESYCATTANRIDTHMLKAVKQLEQRVVAASLQTKGWRPSTSPDDDTDIVTVARQRLAAVEAHIERRYLKPPLAQSNAEATLGAVLQGEHGNSSAPSPQNSNANEGKDNKGIARGLATWREAVARCNTSAQLEMLLQALEAAVAWDKSIMKANCQFCLSGDTEDQLLICDGCDKGYHTYCFKPIMDKIPEGDWYCWECVNKARGERVCIVCGGTSSGRTIPCALCSRAYHQDCHYPPLQKNPRGKWYCSQCVSRAPPKKPRNTKKRDSKHKDNNASLDDANMVPSPAPSHASTSTTAEDCAANVLHTPEKTEPEKEDPAPEAENGLNHHPAPPDLADEGPPEKRQRLFVGGNGAIQHDNAEHIDGEDLDTENVPLLSRAKKEKNTAKKLQKDLQFCKLRYFGAVACAMVTEELDIGVSKINRYMVNLLCEMECHEHAWPFLIPVNTKQFPQYKKVIKCPMDLSTIKRKLQDGFYKCKEEFASDVRLIFSNCEVFNEDDSPVGRAGHHMRQFFTDRWQT